jgi:phage terminase large subunit-like protein
MVMLSPVASPRHRLAPSGDDVLLADALALCESTGLVLDDWQADVLRAGLTRRADGRWAAFEVGVVVPRQNGKDGILEARELVGLFMLGERLLIHSAHLFATSKEHFLRLLFLIESAPDLDAQVRKVWRSHGEEGIELRSGQRIRFFTRTKSSARGFSCDCLIFNEAMILPDVSVGAMLPTLSARPNPQVWYAGSAVDQLTYEHGVALARVRERGIVGAVDNGRLAYFEWAADADSLADVDSSFAADQAQWQVANPALGVRILAEHVEAEQAAMDPRQFAVERLGVGDWPRTDGVGEQSEIPVAIWDELADLRSELRDPVCLAFDSAPDRSSSSIAAAGRNQDGELHVEIAERRRGVSWLTKRLRELDEQHEPVSIICDAYGPVASILKDLHEAEVRVTTVSASEHAQACGRLYDLAFERKLRHRNDEALRNAIAGARTRPLGDAWAWSRKNSSVDISPLVAATLAVFAASGELPSIDDPVIW